MKEHHEPLAAKAVWDYLVGSLRSLYIMDELWDDKSEFKFRRSGKTLVTLYLKPDKVTALVIFGKAEREKFDLCHDDFSTYIQGYYDNSKTFHDGKWMFIDVSDLATAQEIIGLVAIKKKPNRKTMVDG